MTAESIVAILRSARFCFANERDLQAGLAEALRATTVAIEAEVWLTPRDRIDFIVGRLGIEVKVSGSWRAVERQLLRYLQSPQLDEVLLVTVKSNHRRIQQGEVGPPLTPHARKRLLVHQLAESGL